MKAKIKIRRHGFGVKLCGNIVAKFELKWLKTQLTERELKMCTQFLEKLVSRKKLKYDLETFSGLRRLKHLGVTIITCG